MNAVSSSALASAATTYESTAHIGADASPLGTTTTPYAQTIIHNGSDIEDPEPKAPLSTRERAQLIPYARRIERGYVRGSIPIMPPPTKWPCANGPRASLLERAIVVAHDYYGVLRCLEGSGEIAWAYDPDPGRVAFKRNARPIRGGIHAPHLST